MASTSFSPELNYQARKPTFNGDPRSLFADGTVPDGWKTMEADDAVAPGAGTGAVTGLVVNNAGAGLEDGSVTGIATTALKGSGTGLKVDLTISSGQVQVAEVNAGGTGYAVADTVSVTGYDDVELGVTL